MSENTKKNLQEAGLKSTLPRLKIMEILENGRHLSAEEIYRDLIANNYDVPWPLNIKILFSKSPPVCFHPLKLSHSHKLFKTFTGCWEDEISTMVVLSLLEALRKKNNPMAKRIVSNNVEFKE